jgi:hypothetical protein
MNCALTQECRHLIVLPKHGCHIFLGTLMESINDKWQANQLQTYGLGHVWIGKLPQV